MSHEIETKLENNFQDGETENGNAPLFDQNSSENIPVKGERAIKKAKRLIRNSPSKEETELNGVTLSSCNVNQGKKPAPFSKNSKKSRNARGRGLPKGGAGGKGTWGKPGSEIMGMFNEDDEQDPNYDSDSQGDYVVKEVAPELKEEELPNAIEPILREYLEHGDSSEVMALINMLNVGSLKYKIPELAISLALDRHNPQREMTSRLISDLSGKLITQEEFSKGFDELLNNLEDLTLDTPDAPTILGQFIARAVADECLPNDFTVTYKGKVGCKQVRLALEKAEVLLSLHKNIVKLDNVWGVGGGTRPVRFLVNKIEEFLKEYLISGEISEATRCLKELDVPHFHHEVVYQAGVIAIEDTSERATEAMVNLLEEFTNSCIITSDQFKNGVLRLYEDIPDIYLDVPEAYTLLERLGDELHSRGILSVELMKDMPNRGRKRFVSEGDGGKLKEQNGSH